MSKCSCVLKGVQLLASVPSPGVHDTNSAGITSMSGGLGDDMSSKVGDPALFNSRSSRLAGPGIGKPAFDSECGKKGSASRQRVRFSVVSMLMFSAHFLQNKVSSTF